MTTRTATTAEVAQLIDLDRSSPVPLYFQVAQALENAIHNNLLPPGTRLENEILIADELGVSRPTMRRALEHLVDHGLIVRRRGIGTRVVQRTVRRSLDLTSLFDDLDKEAQSPRTDVLSIEEGVAPSWVCQELQRPEGSAVVILCRLRYTNDEPLAIMTNYLPTDVPGLAAAITTQELETTGLYSIMRGVGIQLHAAHQSISARTSTNAESELLQEERGCALLTMKRVTMDDHGTVVELGDHLYAASRYSFELDLLRR